MSKSPSAWPPIPTLVAIAAVLVGVPWAFKLATAPKLGQPCGGGFDCAALDGRCVEGAHGKFCTVTCETDADCPSSGYCGVPPHDRWQRWFAPSVVSERFCVPGAKPSEPLELGPGAGMPGADPSMHAPQPSQRRGEPAEPRER